MQKTSVFESMPNLTLKSVVGLLDFCLSKLPSNPPAIYELWDLWLKYLWIVRNPGIAEVELKLSWSWVEVQHPTRASEEAGLGVCKRCPWKVNSVNKSFNAYEQTSSVEKKAAGECMHLRKQYQEAQDIIKTEKYFVAKCFSDWRISKDSATIFFTSKLYVQFDSSC